MSVEKVSIKEIADAQQLIGELLGALADIAEHAPLDKAKAAAVICIPASFAARMVLDAFKRRSDVPKEHPIMKRIERAMDAASRGLTVEEFNAADKERN